jgi:hypothetical protein
VPTLIVVAEMPRPLPPVALPGPQMALRSPKSPLAAEALAVLVAAEPPLLAGPLDGVLEDPPERPQPTTPTTKAAVVATVIRRTELLLIHSPLNSPRLGVACSGRHVTQVTVRAFVQVR